MSAYEDSFEGTASSSTSNSSRSPSSMSVRSVAVLVQQQHPPVPMPIPVAVQEGRTNSTVQKKQPSIGTSSSLSENSAAAAAAASIATVTTATAGPPEEMRASLLNASPGARDPSPSTDTLMSHLEVKQMGIDAPSKEGFQQLASYVAFPGSSEGSVRIGSATTESVVRAAIVATATTEAESNVGDENLTSLTAPILAEREDVASHAASSVFSTLSQHLVRDKAQREEPTSVVPLGKGAAATAVALTVTKKDTNGDTSIGGYGCNDAAAAAAASPVTMESLPPLPSISRTEAVPQLTFSLPAVETVRPTLSQTSRSLPLPAVERVLAGVPPPLPSRDPMQDPKIIELRETSEAVERLVRAFALLRGHAPATAADLLDKAKETDFTTRDTERLSSLRRQHGVGDAATIRACMPNSTRISKRTPGPTNDRDSENQRSAVAMNEAEVEEAIMCLVMELLQRRATQPFEENVERKAIQPSFEVVGMDNFRLSPPSKKPKSRRSARDNVAPLSVFDGGMQAFAPGDADASESLYHSIVTALQKYVSSHVGTASQRVGSGPFPPASLHFAWVLQLDLLAVCMQALESRFAGDRAGTKGGAPVWLQYEGPREAESLARNAVHCLPFEAIHAKSHAKPVFRLEYWVTKDKMWTVAEALLTSIRAGIVARSDGYRMFNRGDDNDDAGVDPTTLFPTRVPLFSLRPTDSTGARCDDDGDGSPTAKSVSASHKQKRHQKQGGEEDKEEDGPCADYYHIESAALDSLAHAVSTAGTELLEADSRAGGKNYAQNYRDATRAVSEAVCELLGDVGIRAAVQRRAKAKMAELAQRRETDKTWSQQERERSIIEAAEAEAERVVQRILQEIKVEEARAT
ncbi:hypothetical protein DQ04_00131030 [Trypanosoma grayi]|uniref:hypothetical protein n=1 Tax=Trypanosoma grayi TaxID=71804 RepID=UPI0004F4886C|nr:hypothetical protein DQ04_00131030 [Trypanosoma grayi]KEG15244.1 hypothetical protein DQ04_00131030 [Trypanosoma grayi]